MKTTLRYLFISFCTFLLHASYAQRNSSIAITGEKLVGMPLKAQACDSLVEFYVWQKDDSTIYTNTKQNFTPKGTPVAGGNDYGSAANQLAGPGDVYVDTDGNLYVLDSYNNRVQKWVPGATEGVTVAGGHGLGTGANQLFLPQGFFVDKSGNVYVADLFNNRVQKWTPNATTGITVAGGHGYGSAANQLSSPHDVFVDNNGNLYVTDGDNNRVQKWAPNATEGVTVAGGNGYGSALNQLNNPFSVFVDRNGNVYVSDRVNDRVQKWTPGATEGITVAGGKYGADSASLNDPRGIYVDGKGAVYVADYFNNRIQKWLPGASYGTTVAGGYGVGHAPRKLFNPSGVFVDGTGNLYVSDEANNRVQKYNPEGFISNKMIPQEPGMYRVIAIYSNGHSDTSDYVEVKAAISVKPVPAVDRENKSPNGCSAFPNPATNYTNLRFFAVKAGRAHLLISDAAGRTVEAVTFSVIEGSNTYKADVSRLLNGHYILSLVIDDDTTMTVKIEKV